MEGAVTNQLLLGESDDQTVQIVYASQQLAIYRSALEHWQACAANTDNTPYQQSRARHELCYYTQQVDRWGDYLASLIE